MEPVIRSNVEPFCQMEPVEKRTRMPITKVRVRQVAVPRIYDT